MESLCWAFPMDSWKHTQEKPQILKKEKNELFCECSHKESINYGFIMVNKGNIQVEYMQSDTRKTSQSFKLHLHTGYIAFNNKCVVISTSNVSPNFSGSWTSPQVWHVTSCQHHDRTLPQSPLFHEVLLLKERA